MNWVGPYAKTALANQFARAPFGKVWYTWTPRFSTPYWVPTPGGGWAKQYPPGQAGIPYAWYPEYGLVQ